MVSLVALGADFTWTGQDIPAGWDSVGNWDLQSGYPDGTDDNAIFPDNGGTPWDVILIDEEIGDLTIEESVNFDADGGTALRFEGTLVIDGTNQEIVVTLSSDAGITTWE
jgi:hypothetical protein